MWKKIWIIHSIPVSVCLKPRSPVLSSLGQVVISDTAGQLSEALCMFTWPIPTC